MPKVSKVKRMPWQAKRTPHAGRRSNNYPFYNSTTWRKLSRLHREQYPLCQVCQAAGRVAASQVIDHIVPIKDGGARLNEANLLALCKHCHDRKSAIEAHGPLFTADSLGLPKLTKDEVIKVLCDKFDQ